MAVAAVEGLARVEVFQGRIVLWVGDPDDAHGVALWPSAALEAAREMLALSQPGREAPAFVGVAENFSIRAPVQPGANSIMRFRMAGAEIEMLIDWADLTALAAIAGQALMTATAEGSG